MFVRIWKATARERVTEPQPLQFVPVDHSQLVIFSGPDNSNLVNAHDKAVAQFKAAKVFDARPFDVIEVAFVGTFKA